jgi:hypothetical protein
MKIMIAGYNTNVSWNGSTYHVQTEDEGTEKASLITNVFKDGAILLSKRSSYKDLLSDGFDSFILTQRLLKQHKLICAAIERGRIEEFIELKSNRATNPLNKEEVTLVRRDLSTTKLITIFDAAKTGDIQRVKELVESGVDINAASENGETPLIIAASNNHTDIVRSLLEAGADINIRRRDGMTALICASIFGHTEIVKALLEYRPDVDIEDRVGLNAKQWAIAKDNTEITALLDEYALQEEEQTKSLPEVISIPDEPLNIVQTEEINSSKSWIDLDKAEYIPKEERTPAINRYYSNSKANVLLAVGIVLLIGGSLLVWLTLRQEKGINQTTESLASQKKDDSLSNDVASPKVETSNTTVNNRVASSNIETRDEQKPKAVKQDSTNQAKLDTDKQQAKRNVNNQVESASTTTRERRSPTREETSRRVERSNRERASQQRVSERVEQETHRIREIFGN